MLSVNQIFTQLTQAEGFIEHNTTLVASGAIVSKERQTLFTTSIHYIHFLRWIGKYKWHVECTWRKSLTKGEAMRSY